MKTIRNLTHKPLKIPLPGGKFLHLGPAKAGQIADHAAERPAIQRLLDAKEIEIVGEGARSEGATAGDGGGHESTHGHPPSTGVRPKGNR